MTVIFFSAINAAAPFGSTCEILRSPAWAEGRDAAREEAITMWDDFTKGMLWLD